MEQGYGGSVWHASAMAAPWLTPISASLRAVALEALAGAGDEALGQWEEWTGRAYHVRRRLTQHEQAATGPVLDIRGTEEARRRLADVRRWLPQGYEE